MNSTYIGLNQAARDFIKNNNLLLLDEISDELKVYEDLEGNIYREIQQSNFSTTRKLIFTYLVRNNFFKMFEWTWPEFNQKMGEDLPLEKIKDFS